MIFSHKGTMNYFPYSQNPHLFSYSRCSGFTLIEMAVILGVLGMFISTLSFVLPSLLQSERAVEARDVLEQYTYGIQGYAASQYRLPCPDTDADGMEDRNDSGTPLDFSDDTCGAYTGTLPWRTLGLPTAEDAWHNPVAYGVHEHLIGSASAVQFCDTLNSLYNAPLDAGKLHVIALGGWSENRAFVIVSGGQKNLDGTAGFFDGANGSGTAVQFECKDKGPAADYDDLVDSGSFFDVWLPCCSSLGTGERRYPNGCDNGEDDDQDGFTDCSDQDCAAAGPCGG